METNDPQKSTQSEYQNPALSDEYNHAFDNVMKILSDLPTERAMKELSKGRAGEAVQKVVQTMALQKMELVRGLSLMRFREDLLMREITVAHTKTPETDRVLMKYLNDTPSYEIVAK